MIGVLCGLKSEAQIADRIPNVLIGCSAAQPARAQRMVAQMIEHGVTRLISFGLCGGLSPDLVAGDLLLGATVMSAKEAWEADAEWNQYLMEALDDVMCVPIWGSAYMASRPTDKELIFRRTGCLAIDMESQLVARAAHEHNIPFNVIRAVSDPSDMILPPAARVSLREDGSVDLRSVWQSVKKEPKQIPLLIRTGVATAKAMRSLKMTIDALSHLATQEQGNEDADVSV